MTSWAVVTGASAGLGEEFAKRLSRAGNKVILVARRVDRLEALAEKLPSEARVRPADLLDPKQRGELAEELAKLDISYLINNAGFGTLDNFVNIEADRVVNEATLDVIAPTQLTRHVLPGMIERGRGAIINVASMASFQAIPTMAVYAAAKAYMLSFTIAIRDELRGSGVRATAVCPGPTKTEFFAANNIGKTLTMLKRRTPEQVIDTAFRALQKDQAFAVDGFINNLTVLTNRFIPRDTAARISGWMSNH